MVGTIANQTIGKCIEHHYQSRPRRMLLLNYCLFVWKINFISLSLFDMNRRRRKNKLNRVSKRAGTITCRTKKTRRKKVRCCVCVVWGRCSQRVVVDLIAFFNVSDKELAWKAGHSSANIGPMRVKRAEEQAKEALNALPKERYAMLYCVCGW